MASKMHRIEGEGSPIYYLEHTERAPLGSSVEKLEAFHMKQTLISAFQQFECYDQSLSADGPGFGIAKFRTPLSPEVDVTLTRTYLEGPFLGKLRSSVHFEASKSTEDGTAVGRTGFTIRQDNTIRWDETFLPDIFDEYAHPLNKDTQLILIDSMVIEAMAHNLPPGRYNGNHAGHQRH